MTELLQRVVVDVQAAEMTREQCLIKIAPDVVHSIFHALLGRAPEDEAVELYRQHLHELDGIEQLIKIVLESEECRRRLGIFPLDYPHPGATYDLPAIVLIHIQKTGGTSLQNMFTDVFDDRHVYREHADTLYRRPPGELGQYDLFLGHFNYDSIAFIPKSNISLITFLRNPEARLLSLYGFWRAHEPDHPSFHEGMELANKFDFDGLANAVLSNPNPDTWNHIAWSIMGERSWTYWRDVLTDESSAADGISNAIDRFRLAARARLNQFFFIGMLEDFDRSTKMLAELLRKPALKSRHDHAVSSLIENEPFFKRIPATGEDFLIRSDAIRKLTQLDAIIVDEAQALYQARCDLYELRLQNDDGVTTRDESSQASQSSNAAVSARSGIR
ncbi:sulfotransferase family 2 domain-containing protein [Paraburkholderia sp. DGU8]|uniref:sulfotransferase family 2 domain-containing protein n=1 Tax=Paraburkholderia sp. DGU8 TaxID=3161997 RepID=UPI003466CCD5